MKNHILLFVKKTDKDFDTKLSDFKEAAKDFKGEVIKPLCSSISLLGIQFDLMGIM